MKISTKGRYGLRAMVDLAVHEHSGAIPLREISERQGISEQYLEQLFASLRKSGIVKSVRGAHGGYLLNHKPEDITVKDILATLEGPLAPVDCVLSKDAREECESRDGCVTFDLWVKVKTNIDELLDSVTLAELKKQYKDNKSDTDFIYHI
ncbi:MAG: RrF2 family transcriptional regulator [Halanaerobiales bacterium]